MSDFVKDDKVDTAPKPRKLLDQVRDAMRLKHYSLRSEQTYVDWIKRYILFHGKQHPKDMGAAQVKIFLEHLAIDRHVSASTLGHKDVTTTMIYALVMNKPGLAVRSPLDVVTL